MHLYANDTETFVAENAEEAARLYKEHTGDSPPESDPLTQVREDQIVAIRVEKTAAEWAAECPKGHLCSADY